MAKQTSSRPTRRQLSLLLPEVQRLVVEPIRQRLDPIQHALIPAHVTLCRDDELPRPHELAKRLARLDKVSITMTFGEPEELPDGCVLLRQAAGKEQFQALRQSILGSAARNYEGHLTLLHQRNATGAIHNLASIAREVSGLVATFQTIALVEQQGCDPWQVKGEYGLSDRGDG